MKGHGRSFRQAVGENARRIREEGDARQDDVAAQARALGLSWTRSKLAALERGDKAIDLPEMVLLAAALSQATDAPVRLSDLLEGDDWVQLSGKTPLTRAALRRFLVGETVVFEAGDVPRLPIDRLRDGLQALTDREAAFAPDLTWVDGVLVEARAGEVEQRAGRTLGLSKREVALLSWGLWGRTLAEERDFRVGDEGSAATRSARRGQTTRRLIEELRTQLTEVNVG